MCGIAGYVNFDFSEPEPELLQKMMDAMALRGPDGHDIYVNYNTGLAHTRLSIIDLETGGQPLCNEDGTLWIVFNGEIFNYRALRKVLEERGHQFRTQSDTEVILHLYEECGSAFLQHLDGFFAFALYDTKLSIMLLARDRMGIKPLYYYRDAAHFAFASSINALKQLPFVKQHIDEQALWDYLSLQYVPTGTIYTHISQLAPGYALSFHSEGPRRHFQKRQYWKPDFTRKTAQPYEDACKGLREAMTASVRDRLISDVPLGVFLSGGLDSAIIAGLAAEQIEGPLKCFTIGFEEQSYDERESAAATAAHVRQFARCGFEHHVKTVNPCDFESLEFLVKQFGEPFADASMLPTYLLSRFARGEVKVALSGDGADELFGGYERYLAMRYLGKFDFLPEAVRRPLFCMAAAMIPNIGNERQKWARSRRFLHGAAASGAERYLGILSRVDEKLKHRVCGKFFRHVKPTLETFNREFYKNSFSANPSERVSEVDIISYLREDILKKVDVASMSASLEVRSPFLDFKIAELSALYPYEYKEKDGVRKRILTDAFAKYLPKGLAQRPKRGFGVPLASWFRNEWRELLRERLLDGVCVKERIFNQPELEHILKAHSCGRADYSYFLFSALVLELFLKE